ncbi:MAG: hypothetical protein IJ493_10730 [Clostridia bacterium]|nr:hypothetical protein [Clostridia bacterium]
MRGVNPESVSDAVEEGYVYPDVDYEGYEFKILNFSDFWDCYMRIDLDEQTGEMVDDAVFNRNRLVEDKLNFQLVEIVEPYPGWSGNNVTITKLQQSIMADDNEYDAAYGLLPYGTSILTDGYLVDLYTIPELQLEEKWWDTSLNKILELKGHLYAASSPLQLMSLDLAWVLLFNKNILDNNKLDYPYDLVREGEWTIDKLNEYCTKIASLNGDDSFTFNPEGKASYGISAHQGTAVYMMLISAGNSFIEHDVEDGLVYKGADERLYNTLDKLSALLSTSDGKVMFSSADSLTDTNGYYYWFYNDRTAFLTTELKGTKVMRSMASDYGILPAPKFDENQENYITFTSENVGRLLIPKTNDDLSRSGVILDALSYESKKSVLPLYYNQTISQKGLRDEDSIEMLNIINETRMTEIGKIFGITTSMIDKLNSMIIKGEDNAASIIASNENAVKEKLQSLLDSIE